MYNCCTGWAITGTGSIGTSFTTANEFQVTTGGSVSEIDFAVGYVAGFGNSFYLNIDADNSGHARNGAGLVYRPVQQHTIRYVLRPSQHHRHFGTQPQHRNQLLVGAGPDQQQRQYVRRVQLEQQCDGS